MFIQVKYRVETDEGTMLFLEQHQVPARRDLEKLIGGEPFAYSALNEFRELKSRYMGRNRVVCTATKPCSEGLLMYVSLYYQDLGRSR